jgi:hypothetical protein
MNKKLLLLGAVGLATVAFAAQDAQTLTRTIVEDSTDTYKIESKVQQSVNSPNGDMQMNATTGFTYVIKTGKLDAAKGSADIEVTKTVDKLDSDSPFPLPDVKTIKPVVQKGTVDKLGHFVLEAPKTNDMMAMMISGGASSIDSTMFVQLPDHPVKVGDSWDIVVPKGVFTGPEDQKLTAKLTGDKQFNGHDVWVVDVSGKLNLVFDSSKIQTESEAGNPLAGQQIVVKSTVDTTAEGFVDKATGKTVSMESTAKLKATIDMAALGTSMDSTGTVTSKITLQP